MKLRSRSVKLMSIGRVWTCGQTRAPRSDHSCTRASTVPASSGVAVDSNSGESVVGMPNSSESSASMSTRLTIKLVS